MGQLKIVGLCGSLRQGSFNRSALALSAECMPSGTAFELGEWKDFPFYDHDTQSRGMPSVVTALAERLSHADGVIIAVPEYNFSIPGAFKNAIDWISRVPDQPFARKPVAIMSASPGPLGGARVQYELRKVLLFLEAQPLSKPEIFIGSAHSKFDADGHCIDDATRKFVKEQMVAFSSWIVAVQRLRGVV